MKMTRQCSLMKGAVEDEIKESAEISVINSELDSKDGELLCKETL